MRCFRSLLLPDWLEWLGRLVPIRFAYDGARAALFSGTGWGTDALVLLAFGAVGAPLALAVLAGALAHARRKGTISEY